MKNAENKFTCTSAFFNIRLFEGITLRPFRVNTRKDNQYDRTKYKYNGCMEWNHHCEENNRVKIMPFDFTYR